MQSAPVMNMGVRFLRFSIFLPCAFFLDPLTCLKSKLALSFNIVLRVNALYYAKINVFLSIYIQYLPS